jgi:hypothetical protein
MPVSLKTYLNGGKWELVGEYIEVETGKGADALDKRPQLKAALAPLAKPPLHRPPRKARGA